MAHMTFSGHDSEQPVNPSNVHLVVNSVPASIHTAMPDGYLDFFNETSLTYMGGSLEDVQGWKWISSIHPDDVEGIVAKWRAALASGEPFLYERASNEPMVSIAGCSIQGSTTRYKRNHHQVVRIEH